MATFFLSLGLSTVKPYRVRNPLVAVKYIYGALVAFEFKNKTLMFIKTLVKAIYFQDWEQKSEREEMKIESSIPGQDDPASVQTEHLFSDLQNELARVSDSQLEFQMEDTLMRDFESHEEVDGESEGEDMLEQMTAEWEGQEEEEDEDVVKEEVAVQEDQEELYDYDNEEDDRDDAFDRDEEDEASQVLQEELYDYNDEDTQNDSTEERSDVVDDAADTEQ